MALPLPKLIPDVGPGGPFVTALGGVNALQDAMLEKRMKEIKMPFIKPSLEQEMEKNRIANALKQVELQYAPQMTQATLSELQMKPDYMRAQMGHMGAQNALLRQQALGEQYKLNHPELMYSGDSQFLEYLKRNYPNQADVLRQGTVNQPGTQQEEITHPQGMDYSTGTQEIPKTGNALVDAIITRKTAPAMYQQRMNQAFDWVHTPMDARNYQIAQLAGAGIDPSEGIQLLSSGKTVPQILESKGFDPRNPPEPDFLPTKGNITSLKQRQAALSEIQSLNKKITSGLAPYIKTIRGYSPQQIADALSGQNKDKQAEFLAARSLAPELANLRLKLAGGQAGITAQTEMSDKAFTNIHAFQSLVDKDVFIKSQELVDQWLNEAFEKANKRMTQVGKESQKERTKYKQEDISFTAKKYKISEDEVKRRLGIS